MNTNISVDTQLTELMEVIDFTLSKKFIDKWKFKYSESFLLLFRNKMLEAFEYNKPIKRKTLTQFFITRGKYSEDTVTSFYDSINIDDYYPIILK